MSNRSALEDCPVAVCVPVARLQEQLRAIQATADRIEASVDANMSQQNTRIGALEAFSNRARGVGIVVAALGGVAGIYALATKVL